MRRRADARARGARRAGEAETVGALALASRPPPPPPLPLLSRSGKIADLKNIGAGPYGGAITAAL